MRYRDTGIVELRQTAENYWTAKYQGNYGLYTIKITTDGTQTVDYDCSCPSDGDPCKHIPMIEKAIAERIAQNKKNEKHNEPNIKELIKNISYDELRSFIITQTKYIPELLDAILLEFVPRINNKNNFAYTEIIGRGLESVEFDKYDYCSGNISIDVLDMWIQKAWSCAGQKQYNDAILIAKACIEEYAQWLYESEADNGYEIDSKYHFQPFKILSETVQKNDEQDLQNYCLSEMKKEKYSRSAFRDYFQRLLEDLSYRLNPDSFLSLQDELLSNVADKGSYQARTILQHIYHNYVVGNIIFSTDFIALSKLGEDLRATCISQKFCM